MSVNQALEQLERGYPTEPLISFWFDDGLSGVRDYAAPILAGYGATGAISVCSRFVCHTEMFWRFKLSYLHAIGADAAVRDGLAAYGCGDDQLRVFTLDHFQPAVLDVVDEIYTHTVPRHIRNDAFRIFETSEGLLDMKAKGWVVANHSAAHYPIGESHTMHLLLEQFDECENFIDNLIGQPSAYWVFPFDRRLDVDAVPLLRSRRPGQTVVIVRNCANAGDDVRRRILRRAPAPPTNRVGVVDSLRAASQSLSGDRSRPATIEALR